MSQIQEVLALWREAERITRRLSGEADAVADVTVLRAEAEALRALYQTVLLASEGVAGRPGPTEREAGVHAEAIEDARGRLHAAVARLSDGAGSRSSSNPGRGR